MELHFTQKLKQLEKKINLLFPIGSSTSTVSNGVFGTIAEKGSQFINAIENRYLYDKLTIPSSCDFIIEEPEQNLFPATQAQLISYLLDICNNQERLHSFTLTTHSPYILTQLNILLFAGLLQHQGKAEMVQKIVDPLSIIEPNALGVYAVQNDGTIKSIIDEETGMISQNYLDSVSEELSVKFQQLYRLLF